MLTGGEELGSFWELPPYSSRGVLPSAMLTRLSQRPGQVHQSGNVHV